MKAARWAPLSGVVYVALWIAAFMVAGDEEKDSDSEILAWYGDSGNRNKGIVSIFLILAASLFFVWFVAVLRGRLARSEGGAGTHTAVAFGAGLVAAGLWMVAGVFFMAISFSAGDDDFVLDPNTYRVINNMGYVIWISGTAIAALLVFATALSSLKGQIVPKWIGWLSFVVGATMLVSVFFVPFLIWLGWMLVVSIVLIWKPAGSAATGATATG